VDDLAEKDVDGRVESVDKLIENPGRSGLRGRINADPYRMVEVDITAVTPQPRIAMVA
jgi:hypothetical protein